MILFLVLTFALRRHLWRSQQLIWGLNQRDRVLWDRADAVGGLVILGTDSQYKRITAVEKKSITFRCVNKERGKELK